MYEGFAREASLRRRVRRSALIDERVAGRGTSVLLFCALIPNSLIPNLFFAKKTCIYQKKAVPLHTNSNHHNYEQSV